MVNYIRGAYRNRVILEGVRTYSQPLVQGTPKPNKDSIFVLYLQWKIIGSQCNLFSPFFLSEVNQLSFSEGQRYSTRLLSLTECLKNSD